MAVMDGDMDISLDASESFQPGLKKIKTTACSISSVCGPKECSESLDDWFSKVHIGIEDNMVPFYVLSRYDNYETHEHFKDRTIEWLGIDGLGRGTRVLSGGRKGALFKYLTFLTKEDHHNLAPSLDYCMENEDYRHLNDIVSKYPEIDWFVSFDALFKEDADMIVKEEPDIVPGKRESFLCLAYFFPMMGKEYVIYDSLKFDKSLSIEDLRKEGSSNYALKKMGLDWRKITWDHVENFCFSGRHTETHDIFSDIMKDKVKLYDIHEDRTWMNWHLLEEESDRNEDEDLKTVKKNKKRSYSLLQEKPPS